MPKKPASETIFADYPTVEVQSGTRLILALGDGRMFGVNLPQSLGADESLPGRAELVIDHLDETGVPQGATFSKFLID
jgi:hypothetical protein